MPPPPGSTLLHVVYAGRGDAFYLEYTYTNGLGHEEHVLVPLDGGPRKAAVNLTYYAPYYKYYLAVGEHIWKESFYDPLNPTRFSPKAIINSHPHDDHLDGLLYLMDSQWRDAMSFNGTIHSPKSRCKGKIDAEAMAQRLGFTQSSGCQVPGIKFYYPSPNADDREILSFNFTPPLVNTDIAVTTEPALQLGDRPVIDLANKITIDTSSENLKSILMDVDPAQTRGGGRMFFTGDSVGHKIWDYVNGKHFTVYKIQHHGSLRNTQFGETVESVDVRVAQETALFALLSCILKNVPDALFISPPGTVKLTDLQAFIQDCLNDKEKHVINGYLDELKRRNHLYLEKCVLGVQLKPMPWQPPKDLVKTRSPVKIWAIIVANIRNRRYNSPYGPLFYSPSVVTRSFPMQPWAAALLDENKFQNIFKAILLAGSIFQFFETFTADAYVLSTNRTHAHPSAATIASLAITVKHRLPPQPVPLYITSGYAVELQYHSL